MIEGIQQFVFDWQPTVGDLQPKLGDQPGDLLHVPALPPLELPAGLPAGGGRGGQAQHQAEVAQRDGAGHHAPGLCSVLWSAPGSHTWGRDCREVP